MKPRTILLWVVCCCSSHASAQQFDSIDLLSLMDPARHVLLGQWESGDGSIRASATAQRALCVIPYELTGEYELTCEFTRNDGSDVVGIILPLGRSQVLLELSGWNGEAHGLARIGGASTRSQANPTTVRPGNLVNGQRYQAVVNVRPDGDQLAIRVRLNGERLIDWSGKLEDAQPNLAIRIVSNLRPALFVGDSNTVFHKITVRHASGSGKPVRIDLSESRDPSPILPTESQPGTISPGAVDLTSVRWMERRGRVNVVEFLGEDVLRLQGADDTVAFLPSVQFGDGTVEVDIASDIFSGIAIRGADTENYDLLYFRPQNSGTPKHNNSVQYVCKGKPGADWRTLRTKFPGKYEAGADLEVNEWFHVRIELQGQQLRAYVDDSEQPVLVVDPMLGERARGKIGLWGWNSYFRSFSFRPAARRGR